MIQIRIGMYETNSSSCHALIIPKDNDVNITKTLNLSDNSEKSIILTNFINYLNDENSKKLANWLYVNGVENVIYNGKNIAFSKYLEAAKEKPIDYGVVDTWDCYDWTNQDFINFFFGKEFWHYHGHDNYLGDYTDENAVYFICSE